MAENRLKLILDLEDNASSKLTRVNREIVSDFSKVGNQARSSFQQVSSETNRAQAALMAFNNSIKQVRSSLIGIGLVTAIAVKGLSDAAQVNKEAKSSMDAFQNSLKSLSATLGQLFEPAIKGLTVGINLFREAIEAALGGFIKLFSFTFEFLAALPAAFKNIVDNIKNVFTKDEDPIGIVEGFQQSFDRALEVANIATDQILGKFEKTRQDIETGNTLKSQEDNQNVENDSTQRAIEEEANQRRALKDLAISIEDGIEKDAIAKAEAKKKRQKEVLKDSLGNIETFIQAEAAGNKQAAILFKGIQMGRAIIGTARGIAEAIPNLPLMALAAAAGAAQIATIQAQQFNKGTDSVPSMLTPGEMVVPRDFASAIRSGDLTLGGRGGGGSFGDINIFIQGGINPAGSSVDQMAEQLGFAFEKELRSAKAF